MEINSFNSVQTECIDNKYKKNKLNNSKISFCKDSFRYSQVKQIFNCNIYGAVDI